MFPKIRMIGNTLLEVFTSVVSLFADIKKRRCASLFAWLIFVWCFGLSCGFLVASYAVPFSYSMMYGSLFETVSIVGLLISQILPLIISILAIRFRLSFFVFLTALIKSYLLGFCQCYALVMFGGAGWLVKILLLFSGSLNSVLLLSFWILHIDRMGQWHKKGSLIFLFATVLVCVVDWCFVAPYLNFLIV